MMQKLREDENNNNNNKKLAFDIRKDKFIESNTCK